MFDVELLIEDIPWWVKYLLLVGGALMSAFASKLPDSIQTLGIDAGIVCAAIGLIAVGWHFLNVWRERNSKSRLKLGPNYLIVGGLLIALAGVGWQFFQPPRPDMKPLQDQIDSLKRQLAQANSKVINIPQSNSNATPLGPTIDQTPTEKIKKSVAALTPQDKGRLADKLFAISSALDKSDSARTFVFRVNSLEVNFQMQTPIDSNEYISNLKQLENALSDFQQNLYAEINNRYFMEYTTFVVPDASNSSPIGEMQSSAQRYRTFLESWSQIPDVKTNGQWILLLKPSDEQFAAAFGEFEKYIAECRQRLVVVQKALQ